MKEKLRFLGLDVHCRMPRVPAYTPSDLSVALTHLDRAPSPDLFGIDPFKPRT
jgi:hypothetical protein